MNARFKSDVKKLSPQPCDKRKNLRKNPKKKVPYDSVPVSPDPPEPIDYPYTEDDETHNIFHLSKNKHIRLPKPCATTELGKKYPNQYTLISKAISIE